MRFPLHIATDMMRWQAKNWWRGNKRVPVVLMLEPLHTCNLACVGCAPERWSGDLRDRLPLSRCFEAVDFESGETRMGRALAMLAPRPWLWPAAVRLGRGQHTADARLRALGRALLGAGRGAFAPAVALAAAR